MKKSSKIIKETKGKSINNIKQEVKVIEREPKPIDEDGYPIKRSKICFKCKERFVLTFSFSQQNYSQKNNLFFWTEREEDKEKFICSPHLRLFYTERRKELNLKKQRHLSSYIAQNLI